MKTVTIMPTKNVEQKVELEKEVIELKSLKKVSSSVDVIIDSIENFSNNITKRNERKNGKKEGCNCKTMCVNCHCPCKQNGKFCSSMCHKETKCSNLVEALN
jgi:hypothetical protein